MIGTRERPFTSKAPMQMADELRRGVFSDGLQGLGLWFWQGEFLVWRAGRWEKMGADAMSREVLRRLHGSWVTVGGDEVVAAVEPNPHDADGLVRCLAAVSELAVRDLPVWRGTEEERPDMEWTVAFEDTLVTVTPEGFVTRPRDERWVDLVTVPVAWDPDAKCPSWERMLEQTSDGDPEWVRLHRMWSGVQVVPWAEVGRWMLKYGEVRAGKGVDDRVKQKLMPKGVIVTSMNEMAGDFGMEGATHARAIIVGEVEDLDKQRGHRVVSLAKSVVGCDEMSINRKGLAIQRGVRVKAKLTMSSNSVPRLPDAKGGLSGKMLMLPYTVSFMGREDFGLEKRLAGELAGIARWCMEGALEVRKQVQEGPVRWPEPRRAAEARLRYRLKNYPMEAFAEACFVKAAGNRVASSVIWAEWQRWKEANQVAVMISRNEVSPRLCEETSWGLEMDRMGGGIRCVVGLALRKVEHEV